MKVYGFGDPAAPALLLLPGTCCHWKSNFFHVIPLLEQNFHVLCVSYDGFDEMEKTEFPTMLEETEKIEAYIQAHCGGRICGAYGCSLGGSFVGLLAARQKIHMDCGILGSSDLDQSAPFPARLMTELMMPLFYPLIRDGKFKSVLLQKRMAKRRIEMPAYRRLCLIPDAKLIAQLVPIGRLAVKACGFFTKLRNLDFFLIVAFLKFYPAPRFYWICSARPAVCPAVCILARIQPYLPSGNAPPGSGSREVLPPVSFRFLCPR